MAVLMLMAEESKARNASTGRVDGAEVKPMFHDFMGKKTTESSAVSGSKTASSWRLQAEASLGASSDLGYEGQAAIHPVGVPIFSARSEVSETNISNRLTGSKRTSSDSVFNANRCTETESLPLMKILRDRIEAERARRSVDGEILRRAQSQRLVPESLVLQPPFGTRIDSNVRRFAPPTHMNPGPRIISQIASDEGSRTGIKRPGILNSIDNKKSSYGLQHGLSRPAVSRRPEPESSFSPSAKSSTPCSRQMTIFYGGQAHVFDDVHPNKADVIMALAGSNGGSWSSTPAPKPTSIAKLKDGFVPSIDPQGCMTFNAPFRQEMERTLSNAQPDRQRADSSKRISGPASELNRGAQGGGTAKLVRGLGLGIAEE